MHEASAQIGIPVLEQRVDDLNGEREYLDANLSLAFDLDERVVVVLILTASASACVVEALRSYGLLAAGELGRRGRLDYLVVAEGRVALDERCLPSASFTLYPLSASRYSSAPSKYDDDEDDADNDDDVFVDDEKRP